MPSPSLLCTLITLIKLMNPLQMSFEYNKCIGDDTKDAARQRLNCIKNQKKIKYGEERFLSASLYVSKRGAY